MSSATRNVWGGIPVTAPSMSFPDWALLTHPLREVLERPFAKAKFATELVHARKCRGVIQILPLVRLSISSRDVQ